MNHRLRRTLLASVVLHLLFLLILPGLTEQKSPESRATTLEVQLQVEGPAGQTKRGAGQPERAKTPKQQQRSERSSAEQTRSEQKTASKPSTETEEETPRERAEKTTTRERDRPETSKQTPETTGSEQTDPAKSNPESPAESTGDPERLVETTSGERVAEPEEESARLEDERTQLAQNPDESSEPETSQREQESLVKSGGELESEPDERSAEKTTSSTPDPKQDPSSSSEEPSTPEKRNEPSPSQPEDESPDRGESSAKPEENNETSSPSRESTESEDAEPGPSSEQTLLTREGFFRSSSSSSQEPVKSVSNEGSRTSVTETFERVRIKKEKLGSSPGGGDTEKGTIEEPSGGSVVAEVPVVRVGSGEARGTGDYSLGVKPGSDETGYPKRSGRRVLHQPLPSVPPWLEKSGEEVRVVVLYTINGDGSIQSMEIHTSSGYPSLDEHVLNKVGQWRFEEGPDGEQRAVVFRFELKQSANA